MPLSGFGGTFGCGTCPLGCIGVIPAGACGLGLVGVLGILLGMINLFI